MENEGINPSNCQKPGQNVAKTSNLVGSHQWQDPEFLGAALLGPATLSLANSGDSQGRDLPEATGIVHLTDEALASGRGRGPRLRGKDDNLAKVSHGNPRLWHNSVRVVRIVVFQPDEVFPASRTEAAGDAGIVPGNILAEDPVDQVLPKIIDGMLDRLPPAGKAGPTPALFVRESLFLS